MIPKKTAIIASVALAFLGVLLINGYMSKQRQLYEDMLKRQQKEAPGDVQVLIAKQNINENEPIESRMVELQSIPRQFLQPQAVTSFDAIAQMIAIVPILKGEQIVFTKLSSGRAPAQQIQSLSMATPIGKRAITIPVDNISAVGGMIRAGDYVDVIATIMLPGQGPGGQQVNQPAVVPVFQNVLVLAVGGKYERPQGREERHKKEKGEEKEAALPLITLALTPQEANLLAFIQEQGRIRLVLRSTADAQVKPLSPASWDTFFQHTMPNLIGQPGPAEKTPTEEGPKVEIYRGMNKETTTLK